MKTVRCVFLLCMLTCASSVFAQTMKVDSVLSNDNMFDRDMKYEFRYDSQNKVTAIHSYELDRKQGWQPKAVTTMHYDEQGHLVKKHTEEHSDTVVYAYDSAGRLTSVSRMQSDVPPTKVEYEYNKKGKLLTRKEYEYDHHCNLLFKHKVIPCRTLSFV